MWSAFVQLFRDLLLWGFVAGLLTFLAIWMWLAMP
jgi:hypothetical protein